MSFHCRGSVIRLIPKDEEQLQYLNNLADNNVREDFIQVTNKQTVDKANKLLDE